jgi:hypothetical protein
MKTALKQLLDRLDSIKKVHPEITDAEVRRAMAVTIYHGFIARTSGFSLPGSLGMFSEQGDAAVRIALAEFLDAAAETTARTPVQRYAVFQDPTVESEAGNCYVNYFGYAPSYHDVLAALARPVPIRSRQQPPASAPWWQFWKGSQARPS